MWCSLVRNGFNGDVCQNGPCFLNSLKVDSGRPSCSASASQVILFQCGISLTASMMFLTLCLLPLNHLTTFFDAVSSGSTMPVALDLTATFHTRHTVRAFTKTFWQHHQKCPWEEGLPSRALSTWQLLGSSYCWSTPSFCSLNRSDHRVPAPWWVPFVAMQLIEDLAVAPVTEMAV